MLDSLKQHIEQQLPFLIKGKLLLAISGGIDSVVLGHLLKRLNFDFALAHCNFQLRVIESDEDEKFVMSLGADWGVKVYTTTFDTLKEAKQGKLSTQMVARALRYAWFSELTKKYGFTHIITAHHADDALETFLINLSRGTGLDGLTGIPEVHQNIVRPLLPFSRNEIEEYATKQGLIWREDSSNTNTKYLRNKIRKEIVPKLKELNPNFLGNFKKTTQHLKGSTALVKKYINEFKQVLFNKEENVYKIPVGYLKKLEPREAYVYEFFKEFGFTEWTDVVNLLEAQSGKQVFSATHRLLKDRDHLYLQEITAEGREKSVMIPSLNTHIERPIKMTFDEVDTVLRESPLIAYVDKHKLKLPLTVRKWENGDYFYPIGLEGKKKLSKFFKDEKFSLIAKEQQWLLCSEDEVVWVIGKRLDDRFKVTEQTTTIIKITMQS